MIRIKKNVRDFIPVKAKQPIPNLGAMRLHASEPCALRATCPDSGQIKFLAYGTDFNLETDAVDYRLDKDGNIQSFRSQPIKVETESLTNRDKRPTLSSAEAAVKQALHRLTLKERSIDRKLTSLQLAKKADEAEKAEKEVVQDDPEPKPEPDKKPKKEEEATPEE